MAKKKQPAKGGSAQNGDDAATKASADAAAAADRPDLEGAQFGIISQFVKDLSFESPNAPRAMQSPGENPQLQVNVEARAFKHADEVYEVDLTLEAKAQSDIGVIYNIELVYGGMFRAMQIPEQYITPVLFVDAPTIMFPFMRRVIADITRDGGFHPLMLDPIDFTALYKQNAGKAQVENLQAGS